MRQPESSTVYVVADGDVVRVLARNPELRRIGKIEGGYTYGGMLLAAQRFVPDRAHLAVLVVHRGARK